ncbi:MFS transporter [Sphingomonas sp. MMS24-JH45]
MKAIAEWFPARERSVATGWFNAGTSLGALLAPPVVVAVSLWADSRVAFVVTGAVGLVWAAMMPFIAARRCTPRSPRRKPR